MTAERRGTDWLIRIEDNGLGIAPENQARVFKPFVRLANRDVPGTGLGLAVCKKIVEGLGGTIWVESELGVGSTFAFTIAAADDADPIPMRRAAPMLGQVGKSRRARGQLEMSIGPDPEVKHIPVRFLQGSNGHFSERNSGDSPKLPGAGDDCRRGKLRVTRR